MNTESILTQFALGEMVCQANAGDISHEESLVAPEGGGNCMNWILGHLVKTRHETLALLGIPRKAGVGGLERYGQGSEPLSDASEAADFPTLLAELRALQEPLVEAVRGAPDEKLAQPVPDSPTGNPNETVGSLLAGVAFHEAYHLGQAGLLRRVLGKERKLP